MLAMVQVHHIRKLHKKKGLSLRGVAKSTGHDFRTVKKYIEQDNFGPILVENRGRPSKMDPYKELIDSWLKEDLKYSVKQRHTAKRVYERLQELFPEFNASARTVRLFVAKRKKQLYEPQDTYLPLKHPPGEAQADFGEAVFIEKGQEIKGYYLNLSFPHSNASYVQVFKSQNQECFLTGLQRVFERMGCVPTHIWFDNLSSAVVSVKKKGNRILNEGFQRFSLHYGFEANFCNPNSGHEKGNVENKVGYIRKNFFVPVPSFESLDEFNYRLFAMAEKDWQREHYKKRQIIAALFEEDQEVMLPLPRQPFEVFQLIKAKASKTGMVHFETN